MTEKTVAMKTSVSVGARSIHRDTGVAGALVLVHIGSRWPKRYHVLSHGKTVEAVAAEIKDIEARHTIKEQKLEALIAANGADFTVEGEQFRVTCATVMERGTDSELVMNISRLNGKVWVRMEGMPIRKVVGHVANIPDAEGTLAVASAFAQSWVDKQSEHAAFVAGLAALLGEG